MAKDLVYVTMDTIKGACPAFQKGEPCPYNVPELKNLAKSRCPAFKDGCPFENVKDVGEFRNKLAEMRDKCKGKANHQKAFELIWKVNVEKVAELGHCSFNKYGCQVQEYLESQPIIYDVNGAQSEMLGHCPFFKFGCPFKTDRQGKPIVPELGDLSSNCPEFKKGCLFQTVSNVCDVKAKFGEIRDSLKAKEKHMKAIELPELSLDYIKVRCPAFDKGKACPYNIPSLKGLDEGCPQFAESKCQFRDVKNVGEFKEKMGEMRDICKGKARRDKAFEVICKSNDEGVERIGHCHFNHNHFELKTDLEGKPVA